MEGVNISEVFGILVAAVIVFGPMAQLVTKVVDAIRNTLDKDGKLIGSAVWNVAAFVVGVALCLLFGINLAGAVADTFPALSETTVLDGIGGVILTGLISGGMASYWHEVNDAKSAQGTGSVTTVATDDTTTVVES